MSHLEDGSSLSPTHINAFVDEVHFVFERMLQWEVECTGMRSKADWAPSNFVSGIITLQGGYEGKVVLGFTTRLACRLTETLLRVNVQSVNDDVADAICEMTNTVTGRAAPCLSKQCIRVGVPTVMIGRARPIDYPRGINPLVIEFRVEDELVVLEVGLQETAGGGASTPSLQLKSEEVAF